MKKLRYSKTERSGGGGTAVDKAEKIRQNDTFCGKDRKNDMYRKRCRKIREQNRAVLRIMIKISKITAVSRKNKR